MYFNFIWDTNKAGINYKKHEISFERATTVFRDPNAVTIFDRKHSEDDERWVTMGLDDKGILLVVIHNFKLINNEFYNIRIISARKCTKTETKQY